MMGRAWTSGWAWLALVWACTPTAAPPGAPAGASAEAPLAIVAAPPDVQGQVLARVGPGLVSSEAFVAEAQRTVPADGKALSLEERKKILEELVQDEALWQESVRRGVYRDRKIRDAMINLLLREEVHAKVHGSDFPEEEVRAYYDQHKDEFSIPAKVQILRIFLAINDQRSEAEAMAKAMDLYKQLKARPDKFKELAMEHSEDTYRRRGGDLGPVAPEGKPGVDPAVVSRAFQMKVDELAEPFVAGGGVNLIRVVSRREPLERSYEQVKGTVVRKLKTNRSKELTDAYVAEVLARTPVTRDDDALGKVDLSARMGAAGGAPPEDEPVGDEPTGDEPSE